MKQTKTVAELVDDLFRAYRKSNGREYGYTEIARTLDGTVDPSHISKVRYGQILNPGRDLLLGLCTFFKVPGSYFFPELEAPSEPSPLEEVELLRVALRSSKISSATRQKIEQLIKSLEADKTLDDQADT
jgi:transcriptional regulator with XRE-family HTH domain